MVGWSYELPWDTSFENLEPSQKDEWAKNWLKTHKEKQFSNTSADVAWRGDRIVGIRLEAYDYTPEAY